MKINDVIWIYNYLKNYSGLIPIIIVYIASMGYVFFDIVSSSFKKPNKNN